MQGPGRQDRVSRLCLMNKDVRDVWTHLRSHSREGFSRIDPDQYLWSVYGSINLGYRLCGFESVMKAMKTDINYAFISEWSCPLCSYWQNYHRHTKTHYRAKENSGGWPKGIKQGPKNRMTRKVKESFSRRWWEGRKNRRLPPCEVENKEIKTRSCHFPGEDYSLHLVPPHAIGI